METIKSWYHRIDVQVNRLIRQTKKVLTESKGISVVRPSGSDPADRRQSSQNLDADQGPRHCHSIPIPEASSGSSGDRAKPVCDTRTCWKTSS